MISLQLQKDLHAEQTTVYLVESPDKFDQRGLSTPEITYLTQRYENKQTITMLNRYTQQIYVVCPEQNTKPVLAYKRLENFRNMGFEVFQSLKSEKVTTVSIQFYPHLKTEGLAFVEGLLLSTYQFLRYRGTAEKEKNDLSAIQIVCEETTQAELDEMLHIVEANFLVRNLVNEPQSYLTALKFSEEMEQAGKDAGFAVEVLHKAKIESLNMTGLLAVNAASKNPPTFTIMEYKPENAKNTQPIVLVGKGVVYDTGGLSLKPTPQSMDFMKCDMAGGAMMLGTMYAVAKNKLPLHVVALIPATDNCISETAFAPGDILTMMNGKTVEVLNTDAEGRLILADALCYAERYAPALVIDAATLTGASVRAIAEVAASLMSTADKEITQKLIAVGEDVYERLVEFPLWDEYGDHLKSDIADMTNLGKSEAGQISAGKFLECFTSYPWMHLDIAGTAYLHAANKYRGKYGTGYGVRLLYHFLKNYGS
jgi:leucyl aminopeptidase